MYLDGGEEEKISAVVASAAKTFKDLPADFLVDGLWVGRLSGRKTAVKPHDYQAPGFPAHFTRTRCVFCSDDHKCLL